MKKFSTFKIIQLSLLVVLTLASLYFLMKPQVKAIYILIYFSNNFICSCLDCPAVKFYISFDRF